MTAETSSARGVDLDMALHWIDRYASGIDVECQLDRVAEALGVTLPEGNATTPPPPPPPPAAAEAREIAECDQFADIVNALHGAGEPMNRAVSLAREVAAALSAAERADGRIR